MVSSDRATPVHQDRGLLQPCLHQHDRERFVRRWLANRESARAGGIFFRLVETRQIDDAFGSAARIDRAVAGDDERQVRARSAAAAKRLQQQRQVFPALLASEVEQVIAVEPVARPKGAALGFRGLDRIESEADRTEEDWQ